MIKEDKNTVIADIWVDAPSGFPGTPDKIHFKVDTQAMKYAQQYTDMLYVIRNIPFDLSRLTAADPISLVAVNQLKIKGDDAVRIARQWYSQWQHEAQNDALMLAFLHDNKFDFEPQPYVSEDVADEILFIPTAKKDLNHKVERKLKQISDMMLSDADFNFRLMREFNNAIGQLVNIAEDNPVTDDLGFHDTGIDRPLHSTNESEDNSSEHESGDGGESKIIDVNSSVVDS